MNTPTEHIANFINHTLFSTNKWLKTNKIKVSFKKNLSYYLIENKRYFPTSNYVGSENKEASDSIILVGILLDGKLNLKNQVNFYV